MFNGFSVERIGLTNGVTLRVRYAGTGRPVLLLHGYPQTSACWHEVAPELVEAGFTVIAPDLRGYGGSDKPETDIEHLPYSKREMAADQQLLMQHFGHEQFLVAGHDRGARVAHRLALDYPEAVSKLAVLDIAPTATMYRMTNKIFASAYYHWFFLIQPAPLPETLIGSHPEYYLKTKLSSWGKSGMPTYHQEALDEYVHYFKNPQAIHASCEDYRAAASIDLLHDEQDAESRIRCPLLALWGAKGVVGKLYDVVELWKEKANQVQGQALPCGHFLPEEQPRLTSRALIDFFNQSD